MRLHIGKAFNSLKLTDYLEEEQEEEHFGALLDKRWQLIFGR